MDAWTAPSALGLDIVSAVSTQPNRWTRCNIMGQLGYTHEPNEILFKASTGRLFQTRFAGDSVQCQITQGACDRQTMQMLEEFRRLGTPVYIYPALPGTIQGFWPLRNGVGGDPDPLVYSSSLGNAATTVYLLDADTRRGVYFREIDPSVIQIRGGLPYGSYIGVQGEFCMGRGAYLWKEWTNHVKNSLFGDLTSYVPANWTQSGGTAGTDCGVRDGVFGLPALWIWGTGVTWSSAWFSVNAGTISALSFATYTDGSMTVTLETDVTRYTKTVGPGGAYTTEDFDIPAAATKARFVVAQTAGTWGEFSAPQALGGLTGFDNSFTPYFLGSSGTGTTGNVNPSSLTLTGQNFAPQGGTGMCLAVCGYYMPTLGADTEGPTNGLVCLQNTTQGKSISLEASDFGTGLKLHIRQDDVIKASSSTWLPGAGMSNAWSLLAGWTTTPAYHLYGGLAQVNDAPSVTVSCDTATSVDPLTMFDKISVGQTQADSTQCDGIIGGVHVATIPYASRESWLRFIAHRNHTDLWRNHYGRQYRILLNDMSPMPWTRNTWRGTLVLEQLREL